MKYQHVLWWAELSRKSGVLDNGGNHECGTVAERLTNRENVPDTSFEP
jgi:hypothetical protein